MIFLCQSGAPSQVDLFDEKPVLTARHGEELPAYVRQGQRLTTMTSQQTSLPLCGSPFRFARHGQSGATVSELLPFTAKVVDQLCFIRTLHTEAINHDPAITFLQTGAEQPGRPSFGAWVSYALGCETSNLPAFVVLLSGGEPGDQPLYGRLWGAGFLPSAHQGVRFLSQGDPVPFLSSPPGVSPAAEADAQATLEALERSRSDTSKDRLATHLRQFELAGAMQTAVPELVDFSRETPAALAAYGPEATTRGTFAHNCLLARRLVERGVRFVQLYHRDWDHHTKIVSRIQKQCTLTDQPSAALVSDLAARGLLDDTLVIWAGEFGRTAYCQGKLDGDYGRDHHPRCFTIWLAGGGVKPGLQFGRTDDFSYNISEHGVHVHDLQATVLHLLGIDHHRLTYRSQSRDFRLTDIGGNVVHPILR